jgi:hypothetical protein
MNNETWSERVDIIVAGHTNGKLIELSHSGEVLGA